MPRSKPPQLPCKGCGAVITGYRRLFCTLRCGEIHHEKNKARRIAARKAAVRAIPRKCKNPSCNVILIHANLQKTFCSNRCKQAVLHVRPPLEYEKWMRDNRTARNEAAATVCSICGNSTARKGYYIPKPLPMVPGHIKLCAAHARGYAVFVSTNKLDGHDLDEVFTAYLIHKTFATSTRAPFIVMMREAFHSRRDHNVLRNTETD